MKSVSCKEILDVVLAKRTVRRNPKEIENSAGEAKTSFCRPKTPPNGFFIPIPIIFASPNDG